MTAITSKLSAIVAGALVLATGSTAFAADLGPYKPYQAPPPVVEAPFEAPIWQGAYVGINGGYGWANSGEADPEGVFGGGQLGYNWQRDRFVFGLEGDIQASDMDDSRNFTFAGGFGRAQSDIDWFSTIRARAGVTSGPALFYVTGGVAFADIDNRLDVVDGGVPIAFRDSDTRIGYAVGGGLEWKLDRNWSAKAEYLYLDFGGDTVAGSDDLGNRFTTKIDTDAQLARVGLNYKF
ncbi:MAG: outer membrane protein [Hyphomicrobium sp.]